MSTINCCPVIGITPEDYLLIFADEAVYPSAAGVSGYVNSGPPPPGTSFNPNFHTEQPANTPNSEWYEDMDTFNELISTNKIDLNKILIFHVFFPNGSILPLYPTVDVLPGYEMPISLDKIISPTPRNADPIRGENFAIERPLSDGQTLTGQWILDRVIEKLNPLIRSGTKKSRIIIFVDDSPSLGFGSVAPGVNNFIQLTSNNFNLVLIKCITERWLRWISNTYSGNIVCS
jgi:hypothetical protein